MNMTQRDLEYFDSHALFNIVARKKGFNFAAVLTKLYTLQVNLEDTIGYKENNGFYVNQMDLTDGVHVSRPTIINIVTELKRLKMIEVKKKGNPPKNYYKVNVKVVQEYFFEA